MSRIYVRARVGDDQYAFPVEQVLEVTNLDEITPVPGAPAAVMGVRNLRGQLLPVIDLAAVTGVSAAGIRRRVVVSDDGVRRAGLAVDEVQDVGELPGAREVFDRPYFDEAVIVDGRLVGLVKIGEVLESVAVGEPSDEE
jgi:purine-binding chemotaxis protein CheW